MPYATNESKFGGLALVDPKHVIEGLRNNGYNPSHIVGKANSMTLPRGFEPGLGWVLMRWQDYQTLSLTSLHSLHLTSFGIVEIKNLIILGYESVVASTTLEPNSVVMVHLADCRHLAKLGGYSSWPGSSINVHTPDYLDSVYYQNSKTGTSHGGSHPGWQTLIQYYWSKLPSDMPAPQFHASLFPEKKPEGFDFQGWNAWEAIKAILTAIDHTVIVHQDGRVFVAALGNAGPLPGDHLDNWRDWLYDDLMFTPNPAAYAGAKTVTHFENHDYAFQKSTYLEECTPKTYKRMRTIKSVEMPNLVEDSFGGTFNHAHSTLKALYNIAGAIQNNTVLNTEAQKFADRISDKYWKATFHRVFTGFHSIPITDFDRFSSISWYDFGVGLDRLATGGAFTEVLVSPTDPPQITPSRHSAMYYSPGGYPGPPDLATPHMEPEYLAIARPTEVVVPRDARETFFRFGLIPQNIIEWDDAPQKTPFHNPSYERLFFPGSQYPAYWHQQVRKWLLLDGEQLILVKANEYMLPGSCCNATIQYANDGEWESGATCILQDSIYRTFCAPGDYVWARPLGSTSDAMLVCEALGENGLDQFGLAISDIECGAVGYFYLQASAQVSKTLPSLKISNKTSSAYYSARRAMAQSGGCSWSNLVQIQACAEPGVTRKIFKNEILPIKYNPSNRNWTYRPKPQNVFATATLGAKMCQNGTFPASNLSMVGDFCRNTVQLPQSASVVNWLNMQGQSGDDIYLQFDGQSVWYIMEVEHKSITALQAITIDQGGCVITAFYINFAAQYCQGGYQQQLDWGVWANAVESLNVDGCDITATIAEHKVLCRRNEDQQAVQSSQSIIVVTDVYDDGENIAACFADISVCAVNDEWCEPVIPTTTCESSGSGSGSGQQGSGQGGQ